VQVTVLEAADEIGGGTLGRQRSSGVELCPCAEWL